MAVHVSKVASATSLAYQHRLWEDTEENVFRVSLDTTGNQYFSVRGQYENRAREGQGFEADALAEVGELIGMRHFDIANRDRQRLTLIVSATPNGVFGVNATAGIGRDEYPDSPHGLQSYDSTVLRRVQRRARKSLRIFDQLRLGALQVAPAIEECDHRRRPGQPRPGLDDRL